MNSRGCIPLLLVSVLVNAARAADPSLTAGELAIKMSAERPVAYAEVCVAKAPAMKADFGQAIAEFEAKVVRIGEKLLSTELFAPLTKEPAPPEMLEAYSGESARQKERIKDIDPVKDCPGLLNGIRNSSDELLEAGLTQVLAHMKAMIAGTKGGIFKDSKPNQ